MKDVKKKDMRKEMQDDYLHIMYERNIYYIFKGIIGFLLGLIFLGIQIELYYLPKYFNIYSSSTIWNSISLVEYFDISYITFLFWFTTLISILIMFMGIKIFNKGIK